MSREHRTPLAHSPAVLSFAIATAMLLTFDTASAQPRQPNAAELLRGIERLSVVGRALYVAAHPDDENTRLLAWLQNDRLVDAEYLSLTRGDGGQNLIGSEQGPLLGLIRTQELLAARGIDGAAQRFTRARDFGFSKTPDETLAIWGKDEILADVVWAIRRFQPDVIITRFPTHGIETHGHHTASAILAEEAFKLASDPAYRPDQVALAGTWQARRLVWNKSPFFNRPGEDLSPFLKIDTGSYNPALGISYGEMAGHSRTMHKSQGFGSGLSRGSALEYFQLLGGEPAQNGLFDGVDLTWHRVPGGEKVIPILDRARAQFQPEHPESSIPTLIEARAAIDSLPANPWKEQKLAAIDNLVVACAGLWLEAVANDYSVVPGNDVPVTISLLPRSGAALSVVDFKLPDGKTIPVGKLPSANGEPLDIKATLTIPADAPLSTPYWLVEPPQKGIYPVSDQKLIGLPETPPALAVQFTLKSGTTTFTVTRPIIYKWVDPVAGERTRSIEITPAVTLATDAQVLLFADTKTKSLRVTVKSARENQRGSVKLGAPEGWSVSPASIDFNIADKDGEAELRFSITPPSDAPDASDENDKDKKPPETTLTVTADLGDGKSSSSSVTHIDYPHIPIQTRFTTAKVKLVRLNLRRTKKHIGYVVGAGDEVPEALRQVGYDVTILNDDTLRDAPLDKYEAIVTGVRAFNTDKRLPFLHDKLMAYVKAGGTLLVQYNTANRISKLPSAIGPYPFDISQERVTDENAEVTFELPSHAVLNKPNKITADDFKDWVQERGLYFAGKWDDKYEAVLSMHDAGEPARKGGLLAVKYGKGAFIYTGIAFFRELPAGIPGAYRLFSNLISYGGTR